MDNEYKRQNEIQSYQQAIADQLKRYGVNS
jgi:hypothetical protein